MATIEIPDEDLAFLQELVKNMASQDRCCTADPYYYVVETHRGLIAPSGYGDHEVWVTGANSGEPQIFSSDQEAKTKLAEQFEGEELANTIDELWHFGMHKVYDHHNVFLTRAGYEKHMELDGHNYRGSQKKDPQPYVMHAGRNPEFKTLLEIVKRIGHDRTIPIKITADCSANYWVTCPACHASTDLEGDLGEGGELKCDCGQVIEVRIPYLVDNKEKDGGG